MKQEEYQQLLDQDNFVPNESHSVTQYARCGCNNTCSCSVTGADTNCLSTVVTGLGTPISPYTVKVTPKISACTGNVLTCEADGLCAPGTVVTVLDTDSIDMTITGSGAPANPYVIKSDVLIQDDGTGPLAGRVNALKLNPGQGINGLYIDCEVIQDCIGEEVGTNLAGTCLVYDDTANKLNVEIDPDPNNAIGCGTGPTGSGLWVNPTALSVVDSQCIDMTLTGTGTPGDPYAISAVPIIDPGCPLITCGGAGLCVTPTPVVPLDTPTVDMVITGTGQPGDPWVISANSCSPGIVVNNGDDACINMNVVGGTNCGDAFVLNAFPIISPDVCNGLECRGNGLFAFHDPTQIPPTVSSCQGGGPFGPFNGSMHQDIFGPFCATITNTSPCRNLTVLLADGGSTTDISANSAGLFIVNLELNIDGGPFVVTSKIGIENSVGRPSGAGGGLQIGNRIGAVLAPGGSSTVCIKFSVDAGAVVNGIVTGFAGCLSLSGFFNN